MAASEVNFCVDYRSDTDMSVECCQKLNCNDFGVKLSEKMQ